MRCLPPCLFPPSRGYTLASSPRSSSTGATLDERMGLLLDNLSVTPSWGITTAREQGAALGGPVGSAWLCSFCAATLRRKCDLLVLQDALSVLACKSESALSWLPCPFHWVGLSRCPFLHLPAVAFGLAITGKQGDGGANSGCTLTAAEMLDSRGSNQPALVSARSSCASMASASSTACQLGSAPQPHLPLLAPLCSHGVCHRPPVWWPDQPR